MRGGAARYPLNYMNFMSMTPFDFYYTLSPFSILRMILSYSLVAQYLANPLTVQRFHIPS